MDTLFTGRRLIYLPAAESTNTVALELIKQENIPEGSLIITDHQTRGRGQRSNVWISEPGKNLTFSLVLKPVFLDAGRQFELNMICSLAVKDLIQDKLIMQNTLHRVKIKWPNDIYADDRKIAGILIENILKGEKIQSSVCGMGININQEKFPENLPGAVSLKQLTGTETDLAYVREKCCSYIEKWYLKLRSGKEAEVKEEYLKNLYGLDEWKYYKNGPALFSGCIRGIDPSGRLIVEDTGGAMHSYSFREIIYC